MQTVQVGEFKARFSEMIDSVRAGQTIVVAYGRNQEKVAALIPYAQLEAGSPRRLGSLVGVASVSFADDFAMTDEELLGA
jgi:antitoxin (DNA-binding transcriptional repressor) of toxin-antitoxin stability system